MEGFSNDIELGCEFVMKLIQMSNSGLRVELGNGKVMHNLEKNSKDFKCCLIS